MRSTASSAEAEQDTTRQQGGRGGDSPPMSAGDIDLIAFYRFVLRSGDGTFAAQVASFLRRDPALSARADRELRALPRGARMSPGAMRTLRSLMRRLGLEPR